MLVKVFEEDNSWVLFDNAEGVRFSTQPQRFTNQRELGFLSGHEGSISVTLVLPGVDQSEISEDNPLVAGVIRFTRAQKQHVVVFNTLAYLCNDTGKTVEKVAVNA